MKTAVALCMTILFIGSAPAGEDGRAAQEKGKGPLAKLPSKPGPHVAKIAAMKDNSWLNLGAPKPDPKWGRARGRSWGPKMPLAPELRGAFLYGEGVHGYAKPDGHYMDDLWLYDINAHQWICLYPGANTKTLDMKLDARGVEVTKDTGKWIPVAPMCHTWDHVTYDTHRRRFLFRFTSGAYWANRLPQRKKWLKAGKMAPHLRMVGSYDSGRCDWVLPEFPLLPGRHWYGCLSYVAQEQALLFYGADFRYMYRLDCKKPKAGWKRMKPKGPKPVTCCDPVSTLDTKRNQFFVVAAKTGGTMFSIYDIAKNEWLPVDDVKKQPGGEKAVFASGNTSLEYDVANDVIFLLMWRGGYEGIHIFDRKKRTWTTKPIAFPAKWSKRGIPNVIYDPKLNAYFIHLAGDSADNGTMWVYRYKKAAAKPPATKPRPAAPKKSASAPPAPAPAPAPKTPTRKRTPKQVCTGWFSAARNYKSAGMLADARRCLRNITRDYPKSEWARRARQELAKLGTP